MSFLALPMCSTSEFTNKMQLDTLNIMRFAVFKKNITNLVILKVSRVDLGLWRGIICPINVGCNRFISVTIKKVLDSLKII